jgi:hypothetical protein
MNSSDILRRLERSPFEPFQLRLKDDRVFAVLQPHMMLVGEMSAVVATRNVRDSKGRPVTADWRTISIDWIESLSDLRQNRN